MNKERSLVLQAAMLSNAASQGQEGRRAALDWIEIVATVLLALATVATAWSGYQATRWGGETTKASARANVLRVESTRAGNLANTQTIVDVTTFEQWINAYAQNDTELLDFYRERFRDEFKPAFEAWLATEPLMNGDAPETPFVMPEYVLASRKDADRLDAAAGASTAEARRDIQRQSNYVLAVVLFAVALFFAGMSTKVTMRSARIAVLVLGCSVFVAAVVWITTFPVSVSV